MKKYLFLFVTLLMPFVSLWADGDIDHQNWMSQLDGNLFLARLSIPGSHDSCTKGLILSAETQSKTLSEQLDCGVRLFDLRPRWDGDEMYIYHGILKTSVKFSDALTTLCSFLDAHPGEFLFVMMRHEDDGATSSQKEAWPAEMANCLNARCDYIVDYSPTLTVKDLRGKILVMSRNEYDGGPVGGYLQGGGDNDVYDRTLVGPSGASMTATTQDMYNVASDGRLASKVTEIQNLLARSTSEAEYRLFFNHTSGYSQTILGISTEAGVKECARTCNAAVIDYMQERTGPMGFIIMDFAGDDSDDFQGQTLIDLIIRNNYSTFAQELDGKGRVVRQGKAFVVPMGADREWEARYIRKDAESASTSAVDALSVPDRNWNKVDFDDSSWEVMPMPLGSASYGAPYRTTWTGEYNCYWLRRSFSLDEVNATSAYTLMIYHDDDYKVYVNGHLIHSADGWTDPGSPVTKEIASRYLTVGRNVIAIANQQNWGGAYSDCGIYETENVYDGILSVDETPGDGRTYNLQGIATQATTPGMYIRNGKKIIIK